MTSSTPDLAYVSGYQDAHLACLTGGAQGAWEMLRDRRHQGSGYLIGFRQAIWDHEDSNGLPHTTPPKVAFRTSA